MLSLSFSIFSVFGWLVLKEIVATSGEQRKGNIFCWVRVIGIRGRSPGVKSSPYGETGAMLQCSATSLRLVNSLPECHCNAILGHSCCNMMAISFIRVAFRKCIWEIPPDFSYGNSLRTVSVKWDRKNVPSLSVQHDIKTEIKRKKRKIWHCQGHFPGLWVHFMLKNI